MGVKGLFKLLKDNASSAIRDTNIAEIAKWRVGIDASMMIYQMYAVGESVELKNTKGENINHILGTFQRLTSLLSAGVMPLVVFDGPPPQAKASVLAKRKEIRDNGKAIRIPSKAFDEVRQLCRLIGVPNVDAPGEAEYYMVQLSHAGILNAVATEDMDVLAMGVTHMIRGLGSGKKITIIRTIDVAKELGIDLDQFRDLCILLGTDYTTETLTRVGPKTALKLIKKHKTIENIISNEGKKSPKGFTYKIARELLTTRVERIPVRNPVDQLYNSIYDNVFDKRLIDSDCILPKKLTSDDIKNLREFLNKHDLNSSRVNTTIKKLEKHYKL